MTPLDLHPTISSSAASVFGSSGAVATLPIAVEDRGAAPGAFRVVSVSMLVSVVPGETAQVSTSRLSFELSPCSPHHRSYSGS